MVAIVTGGTRGIGAAISKELKSQGHTVAAVYVGHAETAQKFEAEHGIKTYKCDVSKPEACTALFTQIEAELGEVKVLVNNAGITRDGWFHKMTPDQWLDVINVNLNALYAMSHPVINAMRNRGYGRIINISSINGQKGQMGQTNYCAAKAGIIGFTKALALESAGKGITVNCICPGYTDTDMVAAVDKDVLARIVAQIPVGRLGKAEEVASLAAFLAKPETAFITGAVMSINGGQYLA